MKANQLKKWNWLFLFIGWYSLTFAQEAVPVQKSLLWKIEGKELKKPSYLFGTMHLIEKDNFYFPRKLENYIKKSDAVVMELADLNPEEAMKYFVLKKGTLFDYFTNKQMNDTIIPWVTKKSGMDSIMFRSYFEKMKPFVVLQTITQLQFIGKIESYEKTISGIATEKKIPTYGLETIEDQISIFDDLTKEEQAEMVLAGIRDADKSLEQTKKMQEIYKKQQLDSLYLMITEDDGVISKKQNAFLTDRNKNWIPKIEQYIAKQPTFIAVGAAHLAGPEGVIELLKKDGYTVNPIEF